MARLSWMPAGRGGAYRAHHRTHFLALTASIAVLTALVTLLAARYALDPGETMNWPRFGFDAAASRVNPGERLITPQTVAGLHELWRTKLPDTADSSPALLRALPFPDGRLHDVLYLTTKSGSLVALDAATGARLWVRTNPTFDPNKITTSSPLADPVNRVVYSYGLEGKVHKYDAATGKEIQGNGWPVAVTTMKDTEKESSALNAANGFLYITTASFAGDAPPYQGHVVIVNLLQGTQLVFNTLCADRRHLLAPGECRKNGAGIWARSGVVVDPVTGNIFFATGNGPYDADQGGNDWGDSVLEMTGDGTDLIDSYTPANPNSLNDQDLDIGSAAPALLPVIPGSATPSLAVQASKEGVLRLLNREDLSGQGGPGHIGGELQTLDAPSHCPVLTQPAVWTDPAQGDIWVFVTNFCAMSGYKVSTSPAGVTTLKQIWSVDVGASSPIVAGGVLFAASTDPHVSAVLALDPRSGHQLWSSASPTAGGSIGAIHWESPIAVRGRLYCADDTGQVVAYGLG
jgi:outer membrane protein assembly factor BamB